MTARRTLVVAPLLALGVVLGPSTAARAAGELGLSRDGRTWSDRIEAPLFDGAVRWVPGDRRSATFYVRNQAPGRADLAVDLDASADPAWVSSGGLDVTAQVSGRGVPTTPLASGWRLASARAIAPGEVLTVVVSVSFPTTAGNATRDRTLRAALRVRLAQDLSGTGSGSGAGSGSGSEQPPAGADGSGSGSPGADDAPDDASGTSTGDGAGAEGSPVPATRPNGEPAWLPGTGGPPGWVLLAAGLLLGLGGSLARHGPRTARVHHEPQHEQHQHRGAR